jgi:hypothetical protein
MARVEGLQFRDFDGRTLRLSVAEGGVSYARFLTSQRGQLADLVKRATGRDVRVEVEALDLPERRPAEVTGADLQQVQSMPVVGQALELFEATIFKVERIPPGPPCREERSSGGAADV